MIKLPTPGPTRDRMREVEWQRQIEAADKQNHKRGQDVEIGEARLILTSPDGSRWSIEVDNAGNISATSV